VNDSTATPTCPTCGAPVSARPIFCKRCGYDEELATSEDAYLDGVDVPEGYAATDAEPYEPASKGRPKAGRREWTIVVAVVLVLGLVAPLLARLLS
jgi:hypothetical protein